MKLPVFSFLRPGRASEPVPFAIRVRRFFALCGWLMVASVFGAAVYGLGVRMDAFVRQSDFFEVREVRVVGATRVLNDQIQEVVATLKERGEDNLVTFNLERVLFQVRNLPRVREVKFEKVYPNTLAVEIEERRPVTVANVGELFWIDREGVLLGRAAPSEVAEHHAPLLTGVQGSDFYAGQRLEQPRLHELLESIEFLQSHSPELAQQFAEWNINPQNEITGILREGVEVRFGESHPLDRLPRLDELIRRKGDLAHYTYVDLRFDSQIVYL